MSDFLDKAFGDKMYSNYLDGEKKGVDKSEEESLSQILTWALLFNGNTGNDVSGGSNNEHQNAGIDMFDVQASIDKSGNLANSTLDIIYTSVVGISALDGRDDSQVATSLYNEFLERSSTLMDLNQAYNNTEYVRDLKNEEKSNLYELSNQIMNQKYRKMMDYRHNDYRMKMFSFGSQILIDFIILLAIVFMVISLYLRPTRVSNDEPVLSKRTATLITVILAAIWAILAFMRIHFQLQKSRPFNWDRYYWSALRDTVRDCYII